MENFIPELLTTHGTPSTCLCDLWPCSKQNNAESESSHREGKY